VTSLQHLVLLRRPVSLRRPPASLCCPPVSLRWPVSLRRPVHERGDQQGINYNHFIEVENKFKRIM
jgi:hypothetical protein